jgi:MOSC domain-containing protein YiiM
VTIISSRIFNMTNDEEIENAFPRTGRVEWIGIAPARLADVEPVEEITVHRDTGIVGEHHAEQSGSHRQVTLIQQEHLTVIAALMKRDDVPPDLLRRNIVVSGLNLLAVKTGQFRIGDVLLEGTGPCVPCSRMEDNLGIGGYNAMQGHGGITARVLEEGVIRLSESVSTISGCKD